MAAKDAYYPGTLKAFTEKHNYTQDVMAVDVNDLQNEVGSMQGALGLNPAGGYATVADRLDALGIAPPTPPGVPPASPVIAFQASGITAVYNLPVGIQYGAEKMLPMSAPPARYDPMGWYNGTGFTIQKSGFYHLFGTIRYESNAAVGFRRVNINSNPTAVGTSNHIGSNEAYGPAVGPQPVMTTWFGLLNVGTKIFLAGIHNMSTPQPVLYGGLAGYLVREG